ncbi:MAG: hypothetical protein J6Y37_00155 [Paludibacteraceae bacterium]|nr:hypothetical protein [Paludibacteraceae bacterium]
MGMTIDRILNYGLLGSVVPFFCQLVYALLLRYYVRVVHGTVDPVILFSPWPQILLFVSGFFLLVGCVTFLLAALRKRWKVCLAVLVAFFGYLLLFFYCAVNDPWGAW